MEEKILLKGKPAKALFVAGDFNDGHGKPSKIADKIFARILPLFDAECKNGGNIGELYETLERIKEYQAVVWLANISNDKPKIVSEIKDRNPSCLLITSKRNLDEKYTATDIIYRALKIKSNLVIEFGRIGEKLSGRIMDPLGNLFIDKTEDFDLVAKVLAKRARELFGFTRMKSEKVDELIPAPDEEAFYNIVRNYGNVFHNIIHPHPDAAGRFFGNASFRCESGFPSMKAGNKIFVSKRNVDKRSIEPNSFVAVDTALPLRYYGDNKPSVDTPIQVMLYEHYPGAHYMLHSHVYVNGAPFTSAIVPCGALEEAAEIFKIQPNKEAVNFTINLLGHGSLAIADNLFYFNDIPYKARNMPELHESYSKGL
jgi:hypothetical protein